MAIAVCTNKISTTPRLLSPKLDWFLILVSRSVQHKTFLLLHLGNQASVPIIIIAELILNSVFMVSQVAAANHYKETTPYKCI